MRVPHGYRLDVHHANEAPGVVASEAGVWLAHLGRSSDDLETGLEHVVSEVKVLLERPPPRVLLVLGAHIAALLGPDDPAVNVVPGHILWTLDAAALAGAPRAPTLVQRLLRTMYLASSTVTQSVCVLNVEGDPARALVTLLRELGISVRAPAPERLAVLADVHRPEGVILSGLLGAPLDEAAPAGEWLREINVEKDRAGDDAQSLERLETEERGVLEQRLTPPGAERRVAGVDRAPRLCRLLLAVTGGSGSASRAALYEELVSREVPLLAFADPRTGTLQLSGWAGGHVALPVYADRLSLSRAARDVGRPVGSFAVAEMNPAALFQAASNQGVPVAMCVYAEATEPIYVFIDAEDVRALADGRSRDGAPPEAALH